LVLPATPDSLCDRAKRAKAGRFGRARYGYENFFFLKG
jgi:hypothetical protein